ncbi:conserved hypothetical protein [Altererythrobacter sp. B11]|uniref:hypothetical protein n=1 Tax=Altererythrobacter sp. B11 TaxID=2060312 RepID=UPI000DC71633|nr:hypothetical protein [Altererythrobacter sp. B11]BBC72112.1 conserved hypothetical protein [Altererythrobacter sp. B11]
MRYSRMAPRTAMTGAVLAALAAGMMPSAAAAQDSDARLRKIEAEIRALQRSVFPGADGRYFTPEVTTPPQNPPAQPVGTPSTTAVTDMLVRLDSIEAQLATLTARTEENTNTIAMLKEEMEAMKLAPSASGALPPVGSTGSSAGAARTGGPTGIIPVPGSGSGTAGRAPAQASAATPAAARPSAERLAAVQAIAKPATDDPGDDEYVYGFRLWDAKFYPEAEQQLALFLEKYPSHSRVSYGRNLLGRAYLDDGKPRDAARYFLDNYQSDKNGARAADSLLYLAETMITLGDTSRACIALAEFGDTYPALATGRLKDQYERNRGRVDCS